MDLILVISANPVNQLCKLCHTNLLNGCIECATLNLTLLDDGTCVCKEGYYFEVSTLLCKPCYFYCKTCTGPNKYDCLNCRSLAELTVPMVSGSTNDRLCQCMTKYIMTPIGECSLGSCDITCSTCMGWGIKSVCWV